MLSINTQPVPQRTIAPSSESSDQSGNEEFFQEGTGGDHEKDSKKRDYFSLSAGTIPVESWLKYADLAGIMDAISELQTQEMFISMAKKALSRVRNCDRETKNFEFSILSSRFFDLLSHINSTEGRSGTIPGEGDSFNQLKLNGLASKNPEEIDWNGMLEILDEQQKLLANKKEHLQSLANAARQNIEKHNNTDHYRRVVLNQDNPEHLPQTEIATASNVAIETQALQLPKRAIQLINN